MPEYDLSENGTTWELNVLSLIRYYEARHARYFLGIEPVASGDFEPDLDGPSRFLPQLNRIELHKSFARFEKLCRILVLHELIHSKLCKIGECEKDSTTIRFRKEVEELWDQGAYAKLL